MKSITLKLNPDERGEENREFDEAMKRNPPVICPAILTENGLFFLDEDPLNPPITEDFWDEIERKLNILK